MKLGIKKTKEQNVHIKYLLFFFLFFSNGIAFSQIFQTIQIGDDIDGEAGQNSSGNAVSISSDGSIVAIGAKSNDAGGAVNANYGHVRVYKNNSGVWSQMGTDIDGEGLGDESGFSVSLSSNGRIVAIGAPNNDGSGNNAGHVRVYQFNGNEWSQLGADIDGESLGDESGFSVSLSGNGRTVAIGAPKNDGNGNNAGQVRIYEYKVSVAGWVQKGADIDGEAMNDQSGRAIALSLNSDKIAIGSSANNGGAGHVRIYQYRGSSLGWVQDGGDIDGETSNGQSGFSVSLSSGGNTVAIGAPRNNAVGNSAGHVRVYRLSGGVWTQIGNDIDGEAANDQSGHSVSLSHDGKKLAIGAHLNDGIGTLAGHVRIYQLNDCDEWSQVGSDIDGERITDNSGFSVSLSSDGSFVAIGAPNNRGIPQAINRGHVRVYTTTSTSLAGPINLECENLTSGKRLSWQAVPGSAMYEIEVIVNGGTCCKNTTILKQPEILYTYFSVDPFIEITPLSNCFSWRVKTLYVDDCSDVSKFSSLVCSCPNNTKSRTINTNSTLNIGNTVEVLATPNPASDMVTINVQGDTNSMKLNNNVISIVDLFGKEVYRSNISINESKNINVAKFESGIYLYKVIDLNKNVVIKSAKLIIK